jgi:hypothetical protein
MRSHDTYSITHDTHALVGVHALLFSGLGVFNLSGLAQMPSLPSGTKIELTGVLDQCPGVRCWRPSELLNPA